MKLEVNQISTKRSKDGITTMLGHVTKTNVSICGIGKVGRVFSSGAAAAGPVNYPMSFGFLLILLGKNVGTKSCRGRSRVTRAPLLSPLHHPVCR